MAEWTTLNNRNQFRLLCDSTGCELSLSNIINGHLSVSTIHNGQRHSYSFSDDDMKFIVSQYISSLVENEKIEMIDFFRNI